MNASHLSSPKENEPKEKGTLLRNFLPMAKTARKLRVAMLLDLGAFLRIFLTKEYRASPDYFKAEARTFGIRPNK